MFTGFEKASGDVSGCRGDKGERAARPDMCFQPPQATASAFGFELGGRR
jgi:hypothetical protein